MAKKPTRRVVRKPTVPPAAAEPEVLDDELLEEEDAEEEEPEPKPAPKRRTARKAPAKKPEPAPEPEPEDEEEPKPKRRTTRKAPAKTPASRRKATAKKPAPEPEPEPEPEEEEEGTVFSAKDLDADDLVMLFLAALDEGKALTLTKSRKTYIITTADAAAAAVAVAQPAATGRGVGKGRYAGMARVMTKSQMEALCQTDEYKEWAEWWPTLSVEEKEENATEAEATWEDCEDPLALNLRISMAYREAMEIEKWKDPFDVKQNRDDLIYGVKHPEDFGLETE